MTQHHHAPPPDPMPLDPEERALAARLARLGPHGEPSPSLDARVLAAAHAAHAAATARTAHAHGWRRARWPVGVGVAASVVLAAGIAWQMRPLPAPQFPAGTMAPNDAAMTAGAERADAVARPGDASMPASAPAPAPSRMGSGPPMQEIAAAAAPVDDAAATASSPAATHDAVTTKALAPPMPSPEPPVVFDAPSPVDVAAPPPAPPAPPAPAPVAQARQASAARAASESAQTQAAQPVFDAGDADAPEGDVPPATAASPQVRDAWLARIRELAATGRTEEARASLAEFRRRYPAYAIPADLHPLLPPATPASTPAPAPTPR